MALEGPPRGKRLAVETGCRMGRSKATPSSSIGPQGLTGTACGPTPSCVVTKRYRCRRRLLHLIALALFAFAKALRDRRSSRDQRGLVRKALREIGVVLLHDVEHGFPGKLSMVVGQELVQVCELVVFHLHRASSAIPKHTATR